MATSDSSAVSADARRHRRLVAVQVAPQAAQERPGTAVLVLDVTRQLITRDLARVTDSRALTGAQVGPRAVLAQRDALVLAWADSVGEG